MSTRPRLTPASITAFYVVVTIVYVLIVHKLAGGFDVLADILYVALTGFGLLVLVRALAARAERERDAAVAETSAAAVRSRLLRLAVDAEQALLRAGTEQELFDGICAAVVTDTRFVLAWLGLAESAPGQRVLVVAAAGTSREYADGISITWGDEPSGLGPTGTAIRTASTQVANDVATDERMAPWRERLLANGFHASIALPIHVDGRVVAALSVYAREPGVFDPHAVAQLERLAVDAGLAMSALRANDARDRAASAETKAKERLALVHDIDLAMLRGERVEEIASTILDRLRLALRADRATLAAVDHESGDAYLIGAADAIPGATAVIGWRVGMSGSGRMRTEPLVADLSDLAVEYPNLASLADRGLRRGMLLPLLHNGVMHGALTIISADPAFPDEEALAIASEVGDQLAIALRQQELRLDLQDREARLRAILDGSPNPVLVVDPAGRITFASLATTHVFGGTPEEITGRPLRDLVPVAAQHDHEHGVRDWFERDGAGMGHVQDVSGRRLDGTELPLQVLLAPLSTPEGPRALVTVVDLSERVALEGRLRRAERLEVLGQFAGILAHDVRNFFSAIAWSAEFLAGDMDADDPKLADVKLIQGAVKDGVTMTQSILEFARPAQDATGVVAVPGHLDRLGGILRRLLPNTIRLDVTCDPETPHATISGEALSQVLLNLATNARDAMPDGGDLRIHAAPVMVTAATRTAQLEPGPYVCITVTDTGTGMDEITASRAFEAFFTTKADGTTAAGTGLGLASVFLIVSRAGGQIDLQTKPGVGTTFTIHLPVAAV